MTGPCRRRKNFTPEEVSKMQELEKLGKTRVEISREMECTAACVTRRLGSKRRYTKRPKVEITTIPGDPVA